MTTLEKLVALSNGCAVECVDGAMWATDGCVLIRVPDDKPPGKHGDHWVRVGDDLVRNIKRALVVPDDAGKIVWAESVYVSTGSGMAYREGERGGRIVVNEAYLRLCGFGGDVRMLTTGPNKAIHAVDAAGSVVGILMPLRSGSVELDGLLRVDDFSAWCTEQWLYGGAEDVVNEAYHRLFGGGLRIRMAERRNE